MTNSSSPPTLPPPLPSGPSPNVRPLLTKRRVAVVGCCVLLFFWFRGCGSSTTPPDDAPAAVSNRLLGKWRKSEGNWADSTAEFTEGGTILLGLKWVYSSEPEQKIGHYTVEEDSIRIVAEDASYDRGVALHVEFLTDDELVMARTEGDAHYGFEQMGGRWHRIGVSTSAKRNPALASLEEQRERLEQRRKRIGTLIENAEADKQRIVTQLRAMGATSAKSVPNTSEARRLVAELQLLSRDIASLQRDALTLDEAITKAASLARRMEQAEVAVTEDEFVELSVDLRSASDEPQGSTTPIGLRSLLDDELSNP